MAERCDDIYLNPTPQTTARNLGRHAVGGKCYYNLPASQLFK